MVKRDKEYLKNKKRQHLRGTIIWFVIMFSVFLVGYFLNRTRKNMFTLVAGLLVLPVAQYATQLIAIWKFQDPALEVSEFFESIQGHYTLFHSALIPDKQIVIHFDHIIITGEKIYCVIDQPCDMGKIQPLFNRKIKAKGIPLGVVEYVDLSKVKNKDNLLNKIEATAVASNEKNLKEYTQLIAQMMM